MPYTLVDLDKTYFDYEKKIDEYDPHIIIHVRLLT